MRSGLQLNGEQAAFVRAPFDDHLSLKAGPGAGKTTVLVERIRSLRQNDASVLVFSHANRTVDEIASRLKRAGVEGVTVMTLHKYCIARLARRVDSLDATIEEAAAAFERGELQAFEDHVVVDEAQDLSPHQMRIVWAIMGHARVTMVGDLEQSIYGFQGSSPEHFRRFEDALPVSSRFQIRTNNRSTNSLIVAAANAVAFDDIAAGRAVQMEPCARARPQGLLTLVGYTSRGDPGALGACLRQRVEELRRDPLGWRESILVLAHDNTHLEQAHSYMLRHGVAGVLFSNKRSGEFRRVPKRLLKQRVLQFLTIHGIKGGEAHHIILLTGEDRGDSVELGDGEGGSESRRLMYVALTRAIKSFTVLYETERQCQGRRVRQQPCRWLTSAWGYFDVLGGEKFQSGTPEQCRRWPSLIYVTDLMQRNGSAGLRASFQASGLGEAALDSRLFHTRVEDLDTSDAAGEPIRRQAKLAYDLGLEMFVGVQFENHTALVLARPSLLARARLLKDKASRMCVNRDLWGAYRGGDEWISAREECRTQLAFRTWWSERAGHIFAEVYSRMTHEAGQRDLWPGLYDGLPDNLRTAFLSAIGSHRIKYKHLQPLQEHWRGRLYAEKCAFEADPQAYLAPDFGSFFRSFSPNLDDASTKTYGSVRQLYREGFEATEALLRGSTSPSDLCLFSALDCCCRDATTTSGLQWNVFLHLAQDERSPVYSRVEDLMLDERATELLYQDAEQVRVLLGEPEAMHAGNSVQFFCREDYGDLALTASGCVVGSCDYVFTRGPLEVKATLMGITAEHAAQVVWYACASGSSEAYLWDVYRRRLLVWEVLPPPATLFSTSLSLYLQHNPPPGCRHSKIICPQQLRLGAVSPGSLRSPGAPKGKAATRALCARGLEGGGSAAGAGTVAGTEAPPKPGPATDDSLEDVAAGREVPLPRRSHLLLTPDAATDDSLKDATMSQRYPHGA